jgi:hypothetical protein
VLPSPPCTPQSTHWCLGLSCWLHVPTRLPTSSRHRAASAIPL